jgi:pyruvate/2-oxoglutarate dehydrogenase complex dihydrolipoamide dehydrogenase (E3) component
MPTISAFPQGQHRFDIAKVVKRSRAVAKQLSNGVGFLMKKNKITVIDGQPASWPARASVAVRRTASRSRLERPSTSSSPPARGRAAAGLEPDGKLIWTYKEAMVPEGDAEIAAGDRLGRHRHRIRQLLPQRWAPR